MQFKLFWVSFFLFYVFLHELILACFDINSVICFTGAPGCVNDSLLTGFQFVEGFESFFFCVKVDDASTGNFHILKKFLAMKLSHILNIYKADKIDNQVPENGGPDIWHELTA